MLAAEDLMPLVEFLGQALGPSVEVVLHDLTEPDSSIVAIANGSISGRSVGGPVTDLALRILKQGAASSAPAVLNYQGRNGNGRICRSSSYFLRNDSGVPVAVLCINCDLTDVIAARDLLTNAFIGDQPPANDAPAAVRENLQGNLDDLMQSMLDDALARHAVEPQRLSSDERFALVEELNDDGLFLLKGGVSTAAHRLAVSEPTIYRYLAKIKPKR